MTTPLSRNIKFGDKVIIKYGTNSLYFCPKTGLNEDGEEAEQIAYFKEQSTETNLPILVESSKNDEATEEIAFNDPVYLSFEFVDALNVTTKKYIKISNNSYTTTSKKNSAQKFQFLRDSKDDDRKGNIVFGVTGVKIAQNKTIKKRMAIDKNIEDKDCGFNVINKISGGAALKLVHYYCGAYGSTECAGKNEICYNNECKIECNDSHTGVCRSDTQECTLANGIYSCTDITKPPVWCGSNGGEYGDGVCPEPHMFCHPGVETGDPSQKYSCKKRCGNYYGGSGSAFCPGQNEKCILQDDDDGEPQYGCHVTCDKVRGICENEKLVCQKESENVFKCVNECNDTNGPKGECEGDAVCVYDELKPEGSRYGCENTCKGLVDGYCPAHKSCTSVNGEYECKEICGDPVNGANGYCPGDNNFCTRTGVDNDYACNVKCGGDTSGYCPLHESCTVENEVHSCKKICGDPVNGANGYCLGDNNFCTRTGTDNDYACNVKCGGDTSGYCPLHESCTFENEVHSCKKICGDRENGSSGYCPNVNELCARIGITDDYLCLPECKGDTLGYCKTYSEICKFNDKNEKYSCVGGSGPFYTSKGFSIFVLVFGILMLLLFIYLIYYYGKSNGMFGNKEEIPNQAQFEQAQFEQAQFEQAQFDQAQFEQAQYKQDQFEQAHSKNSRTKRRQFGTTLGNDLPSMPQDENLS